MIHVVAGGIVKAVCPWCQLLPLLILELSHLLVFAYLPRRPAGGVTDGGGSQDGLLPHQATVLRELLGFANALNARWPGEAFTYIKIPKEMNVKCPKTAMWNRHKENE